MLALLLTATLAQDGPRARLDEGWRRMELGDTEGAALIAAELARGGPLPDDLDAERIYLAGTAAQHDGAYDEALASYRELQARWPDRPLARDAGFREAWTLADAGDPRAALRRLRPIARDPANGDQDALKLALCEAAWRVEAGQWRRGVRALADAVADPAVRAMPWFEAQARLAVLDFAVDRAIDVDLDVAEGAMAKRLHVRGLYVAEADAQLSALADTHEVDPILRGLLRVGDQFADLADALEAAAVPRRLTGEQAEVYVGGVRDKADAQRVKAIRYWDLGVTLALDVGWEGELLPTLQGRVDRLTATVDAAP